MIVYEFKIKAKESQYRAIDEAIRTSQFIQNKCLRYWMDNKGVGKYDLNKHCAVLAAEFPFADELNSMARQSAAERAWSAISRFYDNCKKKNPPNPPQGGELKRGSFLNSRNTLAQSNIKLAGGSFQRLEKPSLFLIKKVLVL
jgi:transposase